MAQPRRPSRAAAGLALACSSIAALASACSAEAPRPTTATAAPAPKPAVAVAPKSPPPPDYVIGDLSPNARGLRVTLDGAGPERVGVLLDGNRVIVEDGRVRVVASPSRGPLSGVDRAPPWLGGGFLFRSAGSLFRSDTFDGVLNPILTLPESISRVSFGPKSALLRGSEGGRWLIDLRPVGASAATKDPWAPAAPFKPTKNGRLPIAPLGLADVAALADGRALALTEGGAALASINNGDAWTDITSKLSSAPASLQVTSEKNEIYVVDEEGHAYTLDPSGAIIELPRPPAAAPARKAAIDPRWHGSTAPRDLALTAGAMIDADTAVVAAAGDVATVDVRSGAIKSIVQGRLPPNLTCEALRVRDDALVVCAAAGSTSIVASGLLTERGLHIERSFPSDRPFFADEQGALVFAGPCSPDESAPRTGRFACARDHEGKWSEHTIERAALAAETEALTKGAMEDVRWVPRGDEPPLAIIVRTAITTLDPASGEPTLWKTEAIAPADVEALLASVRSAKAGGAPRTGGPVIDRGFSALPSGALRAWVRTGRSFEVSPKGAVTFSPFRFQSLAISGASALAATTDQRLWQTLDTGFTWGEVAAPPSRAWSLKACSPVGCDLGLYRRVGWAASPPDPKAPPEPGEPPPLLPRAPLPEIVCSPLGPPREGQLAPSELHPADRGLGATATPISTTSPSGQLLRYRRSIYSRTPNNPPRSPRFTDETSPFVMVHNFAVESAEIDGPNGTTNTLVVLGPSASLASFKQTFSFIAPFDPSGALRAPTLGASAFAAAARAAGATLDEALTSETDSEGFIPILPEEPGAPADLVFTSHQQNTDIVGLIAAGSSPSVRLLGQRRAVGAPISAVALPGGDVAVLMAGTDGASRVLRIGKEGTTELHLAPGPSSSDLQPANPDALAIAPDGSLAILRTPSGDEPASGDDPALLLRLSPSKPSSASAPSSAITALAPWSTLTSAADPACKSDASGYRAVLQTKAPWLRVRGAPRDASAPAAVMQAEVRWSAARVCIEALELPNGAVPLRDGDAMAAFIVARFAPPRGQSAKSDVAPSQAPDAKPTPNAGRVGVALGADLRQALSCSIAAP